uniref:Uncharacterized protein n=1 Tax=Anguilla anguilla TaxID=7936 RepID=A0A0E9QZD8_ANGAN
MRCNSSGSVRPVPYGGEGGEFLTALR